MYLLALETTLAPGLPLQWVVRAAVTGPGGGSVFADFSFQPLSLDQGQTLVPREFAGSSLDYSGVIINSFDGSFILDMGEFDAPGETNPVTGSDLTMQVVLTGNFLGPGTLCGTVDGELLAPIQIPLTGSTFAAIAIDDPSPQGLPVSFPDSCADLP